MSELFQFQLDVAKGLTLSAKALDLVLRCCAQDEIQPVVIPPMEEFGGWLMPDPKQIQLGVDALSHEFRGSWKPQMLRVSPPASTILVRGNLRLTSAFLFATYCSVTFDQRETSALIYDMMLYGGAAQKYYITTATVLEFVQLFHGYREFFQYLGQTPPNVYSRLCQATLDAMRLTNTWIKDLNEKPAMASLAEVLYKTFAALIDTEVQRVELEGSKGGVWMASLFVWLRPSSTAVFVDDACVFTAQDESATDATNLVIRLRAKDDWAVQTWRSVNRATDVVSFGGPEQLGPMASPWETVKQQIELSGKYTEQATIILGHVLGALIQVAAEMGRLDNHFFLDVCAPWYAETYATLASQLGWDIDAELQQSMATNLFNSIALKRSYVGRILSYTTEDSVYRGIYSGIYSDLALAVMRSLEGHDLLAGSAALEPTFVISIIEHATGLASQVMIWSTLSEPPQCWNVWPMNTPYCSWFSFCSDLLFDGDNPDHQSFSTLHNCAIKSIFPHHDGYNATDPILAWAGNGYVAYYAALGHEETIVDNRGNKHTITQTMALDDICQVGIIRLVPGHLKLKDGPTRFLFLQEKVRSYLEPPPAAPKQDTLEKITLLAEDGSFTAVDEGHAWPGTDADCHYSVLCDEFRRNITLETVLECRKKLDSKTYRRKVLWEKAIHGTVAARHISWPTSTNEEQEAAARMCQARDEGIVWLPYGAEYDTKLKSHRMTMTAGNSLLRFFSAGPSCAVDQRIFIRKGTASLSHCIKVAMEQTPEGAMWIIIT